jgi:hypothetical protein
MAADLESPRAPDVVEDVIREAAGGNHQEE